MHIFTLYDEARELNLHIYWENMHTPHWKAPGPQVIRTHNLLAVRQLCPLLQFCFFQSRYLIHLSLKQKFNDLTKQKLFICIECFWRIRKIITVEQKNVDFFLTNLRYNNFFTRLNQKVKFMRLCIVCSFRFIIVLIITIKNNNNNST